MGDQCANIAKLVPLAGAPPPNTGMAIRDAIDQMGALARRQVTETKQAFRTRNVALAGDLVGHAAAIGPLNREIFNRAVEIGDDVNVREWAMFTILVARALERIADNAIEIAEQTVFVVTGLFREFTDTPQPT
jgi:phosphate transport system protein